MSAKSSRSVVLSVLTALVSCRCLTGLESMESVLASRQVGVARNLVGGYFGLKGTGIVIRVVVFTGYLVGLMKAATAEYTK